MILTIIIIIIIRFSSSLGCGAKAFRAGANDAAPSRFLRPT